jgi:hypothetical protein
MSAITANIVVEPITLDITQTSITQTVQVEPIDLSIFTNTSLNSPGGTTGQLQYKSGPDTFGGVANTSVVSGTLTFTNLANLSIDGGVNGYVLQTDGAGVLSWTAQTGGGGTGSPGGANTQVQYNDAGVFGGFAGFTFNETTGDLAVPGLYTGDAGGLSNVVGANVVGTVATATSATTAQTVTQAAQPNITSTGTLTGLGVNGTITAVDITANTGIFTGDGGGLSNIAAANVVGLSLNKIINGTSNVDIASLNGNITMGVNGTGDVVVVSDGGIEVTGTADISSTVTAPAFTANTGLFTGDGGGLSNIAGANIVGSVTSTELVNGTSNVRIPVTDGDIEFSSGGVANIMLIREVAGAGVVGIQAGNSLSVNGNATFQGPLTVITAANIGTANVTTLNYPASGEKINLGYLSSATTLGGTAYGYSTDASGDYSTAIGHNATAAGIRSVSIGMNSGFNSTGTTRQVAIGEYAGANCTGTEGDYAVSIGYISGNSQGDESVCIGYLAGDSSGDQSVSVGKFANATGANGIAIGSSALATGDRSIVINASGSALTGATNDTFNVKPVRNAGTSGLPAGFFQVAYNPTTGEFVYYS